MKYDLKSINKRKENAKIVKKVIEILAIILIYNIILIAVSSENNVNLINMFGYKSYVIKTDSMEPTININDVVINKEVNQEEIEVGDVITFQYKGEVITHRITKIDNENEETQYTTKGDNNNIEDTFKITYENIKGKYVLTIPYLGKVVQLLENKLLFLIILLIILIFIFVQLQNQEKMDNRREKKKIEDKKREQN